MSESMPPRCKGLFGRRLCNWEGRYSYKPPQRELPHMRAAGGGLDVAAMVRALGTKTYVRDICTRCGQTKERAI